MVQPWAIATKLYKVPAQRTNSCLIEVPTATCHLGVVGSSATAGRYLGRQR